MQMGRWFHYERFEAHFQRISVVALYYQTVPSLLKVCYSDLTVVICKYNSNDWYFLVVVKRRLACTTAPMKQSLWQEFCPENC